MASITTPAETAAVAAMMPSSGRPMRLAMAWQMNSTDTTAKRRVSVPQVTVLEWPNRISTPWLNRRWAMAHVHGVMMIMPSRLASRMSDSTPSSPPTSRSNSGVTATSRCSADRPPPAIIMKRHSFLYEARSRLSLVLAVSSMMIGASISSESGNTTPPYAPRLTSGLARRATTALSSGNSMPIISQLRARGNHVFQTSVLVTG